MAGRECTATCLLCMADVARYAHDIVSEAYLIIIKDGQNLQGPSRAGLGVQLLAHSVDGLHAPIGHCWMSSIWLAGPILHPLQT